MLIDLLNTNFDTTLQNKNIIIVKKVNYCRL